MYIDFMRHWTQTSEDAQVPEEELLYIVDFGYNADSERKFTATTIGLDENKNKGDYVRQDFQLKEIPDGAKEAKCDLKITKTGASIVNMDVEMKDNLCMPCFIVYSALLTGHLMKMPMKQQ